MDMRDGNSEPLSSGNQNEQQKKKKSKKKSKKTSKKKSKKKSKKADPAREKRDAACYDRLKNANVREDGSISRCVIQMGDPRLSTERERTYVVHAPFFDKEVEVFWAEADAERRRLYKSVDVAAVVGKNKNTMSMYLSRNRHRAGSGIYQASGIVGKTRPRIDLKAGCYFLTLEACERFREYCGDHRSSNSSTS